MAKFFNTNKYLFIKSAAIIPAAVLILSVLFGVINPALASDGGGGSAGTVNPGGESAGTVNPGGAGSGGTLQINPPSIGGQQLPGNAFDLLNKVINFLTLDVVPVLISLVILWSAFLFLTAGGDPGKIKTAKQALFWAVVGAIIIVVGQGIILVVKSFFGLPTS